MTTTERTTRVRAFVQSVTLLNTQLARKRTNTAEHVQTLRALCAVASQLHQQIERSPDADSELHEAIEMMVHSKRWTK